MLVYYDPKSDKIFIARVADWRWYWYYGYFPCYKTEVCPESHGCEFLGEL